MLEISGGIVWTKGTVLVATDAGLRIYDRDFGGLSKVDFGEPLGLVKCLTRDGVGRQWLGGKDGVWMVVLGGKRLESFESALWLGRSEVHSIALDPGHEDGVILVLGKRGVEFVRARRKP